MMKKISKSKKQQRILYTLLVLLALVAIAALLSSFMKNQALKREQELERQKELTTQQQIESAIEEIEEIIPDDTDDTPTLNGVTFEQSGLQIQTQEPGNAVIVDTVVLSKPGFIVIYDDKNGAPNNLLNASPFLARGVYPVVSIAIPESLKAKQTYHATIHFDGDDNGIFNSAYDLPITNKTGEILTAMFTATPVEQ